MMRQKVISLLLLGSFFMVGVGCTYKREYVRKSYTPNALYLNMKGDRMMVIKNRSVKASLSSVEGWRTLVSCVPETHELLIKAEYLAFLINGINSASASRELAYLMFTVGLFYMNSTENSTLLFLGRVAHFLEGVSAMSAHLKREKTKNNLVATFIDIKNVYNDNFHRYKSCSK